MSTLKRAFSFLFSPMINYRAFFADRDVGKGETELVEGFHSRFDWREILFNLPLMIGGLIVLGLFLIVLFGPLIAPINPYIAGQHVVSHYDPQRGEWVHPPLEPSAEYPLGTDEWGNDILSMLLYGARNTLVLCAFITMVRILLGTLIGAYAGWNEGKASDQLSMGAIGVITAIPMLISSMILIYALDLRRGLPVFIIALSVIGWTEIAQYIRSEFIVIRRLPYIEGARAVGASNLAIAIRHVLPNILPKLLVITFLEIGAVLIILGELGFVGVYIGGGSRLAIGDEIAGQVVTLSEVPEWGAMLAEGYRWLRAKPFVVIPPAMAFFVAVLGVNAFGEGLRRLIENNHVSTAFLLRKRMVLVGAGLTMATVFIINNTGPAPWFHKLAQSFDASLAYNHTLALSTMEGRGVGQQGAYQAAAYIAGKFETYGLEPGWRHLNFIYPVETRLVRALNQPRLAVLDAQGASVKTFRHQIDFGYMIEGHGGSGDVQLPLTFLGFDPGQDLSWEDFRGLDLRDRIVLLVAGNAPQDITEEVLIRGGRGVLWVVGEEGEALRSQFQLAHQDLEYLATPNLPIFRIRPGVAEVILSQENMMLDDLFSGKLGIKQSGHGWYTIDLQTVVTMSLKLDTPETVEIPCVLGYKSGSDYELANQMVVLFANYDGLGIDPDGTVYPGANHNASGIAILLELARLWQEQALDPRRSVLFVAWGGGHLDNPAAQEFLLSADSFRHLPSPRANPPLAPRILFEFDYMGAGGDMLYIHPSSSHKLVDLLQSTASDMDIAITDEMRGKDPAKLRIDRGNSIYLSWVDAQVLPVEDSLEKIEADKLQKVGQLVSLVLTQIVRQSNY